jgi:hypothetical protein
MQSGSRGHAGAQEAVELISANDLPSWIRQIAEADAAREEAEATRTAATNDAPPSLIKRALPGETRASGPPTSWLSKSAATQEPSENWASEEVAATHWGPAERNTTQPELPSYPAITPQTVYAAAPYEQPADSSSRRKFGRITSSDTANSPIYRRRTVQLAVLVLLLVVLAATLI